ncbi:MAG: hypothetical protein Tsb0017_13900 [Geothermobacteraceae bacterium]
MATIRSRLLASHLLVLALLSALLFGVWMVQLRRATIDDHLAELDGDVRQAVRNIISQLEVRQLALERMAAGRPVVEYHRTYRELALIDFLDDFRTLFDEVLVADSSGIAELRLHRGEPKEADSLPVARDSLKALADQPGRVRTWLVQEAAGPTVWVGIGLYNYFANRLDGYLLAGFPLDDLLTGQQAYAEATDRITVVFDKDGRPLQVVTPGKVTATGEVVDPALRPGRKNASRLGPLLLFGDDGLAASVYLQELDANLLLFASMKQTAARLWALFRSGLVVLTLVFAALLPLVVWLSGSLARPLHQLGRGAARVAKGDFDARVESDAAGELGDLIVSFNTMVDQLRKTTVSKDYLRDIVDSMHEALIVFDADGAVIRTNRAARKLLGERVETRDVLRFLGKSVAELEELLVAGKSASWDVGCAAVGRDLQVSCAPTGRGGLVMVLQDVTRIRQAERALRLQAKRLEESNRELEEFAYVASHDLQEPLRKITAFGDRLEAKCAEGLGETGRDYLARMRGAAGRMQTLISDLLNFSRVTTRARPFEPVDLNEVVRGVVGDLEVRIAELGAELRIDKLPTIDAESLQMRQLFQNLIGNALKFHRPDVRSVVSVAAEELTHADGAWVRLTVADNGIGFDQKYVEKIFGVFQRLHGRSEYEGSGIGLAICQKIVRRHGGTITAHSKEGEGATFIIDLPRHQVQRQTTEDAA